MGGRRQKNVYRKIKEKRLTMKRLHLILEAKVTDSLAKTLITKGMSEIGASILSFKDIKTSKIYNLKLIKAMIKEED